MLSSLGKIFKRSRAAMVVPEREKLVMRVLEPRVLLDAAALETATDMAGQVVHAELADLVDLPSDSDELPTQGQIYEEQRLDRDVVFIDGNVEDIGAIISELDPEVEIHVLDLDSDGVEQMASILDGRTDLAAIHIFSHGGEGFLNLGSAVLTGDTVTGSHVDALSRIGAALGPDGDILIYGCEFGAGNEGRAVAEQLALVTGADIAASDDLTGAEDLGGDWDLEVEVGELESEAYTFDGFKGVLGAFELGTVDAPTVTYVNPFVPSSAPAFGTVGEAGTVAIWTNAGTVDTPGGLVSVDVVATVVSVSNSSEIFVGFGTRDVDEGDLDDPTLDDFRVYVHNTSALAGGHNTGNTGSAIITWQIFESGTGQTVVADIGEVSLTTADIDGVGPGPNTTRETLSASLADLSSYTVQAGTNLDVTNDGSFIRATGTADQDNELTSWVQYSWNSINQLTMEYEVRTPYAYYNHDGDGDLVFTNPTTSAATDIDLDADDSSGATGSSYQTTYYYSGAVGGPVSIADGDITVSNDQNQSTSATITMATSYSGDLLNVDSGILASLGITATITGTPGSGPLIVQLDGAAAPIDYQTAIQAITYSNTISGFNLTPRTIGVQVFDGAFSSGTAVTTIGFSGTLNQPTAVADLYITNEDTTLTVGSPNRLIDNDLEPQSQTVTVTVATDSSGAAIVINPVGAPSPTTNLLPSGAVLTLYDDGSFDYIPAPNASGVDYFNYTIQDPDGFTSSSYASINIQGVADSVAPGGGIESAASDEDQNTGVVDFSAIVTPDTDGSEVLTYGATNIPTGFTITDGANTVTVTSLSQTVSLSGWDLTNIFLTRPGTDDHSDLDIVIQAVVTVVEGNGSILTSNADVRFNVAAVADAPNLSLSGSAGGAMDIPTGLGSLISASLVDTDGSETITSYTVSNWPAGFQLLQNGTPLSPAAGPHTILAVDLPNLSVQTTTGYIGTFTLDVLATVQETAPQDDVSVLSANSVLGTLSITIDNIDEPVTAANDLASGISGSAININPLNNDLVPDGGAVITLIDGQSPTVGVPITLSSGNGTVTLNGDGTITFQSTNTFVGSEVISYTVADSDGDTDTATITVDVTVGWILTGSSTVAEGSAGSYTLALSGSLPYGQVASVDISLSNIDTSGADYNDLATAISAAIVGRPEFAFDGTTLTYTNFENTTGGFVDISGSGTGLE